MSCFSIKSLAKVFAIQSTPNPEEDKEKQENVAKNKKQGKPQKTKEKKQRSNLDTAAASSPNFAFHSRPGLRWSKNYNYYLPVSDARDDWCVLVIKELGTRRNSASIISSFDFSLIFLVLVEKWRKFIYFDASDIYIYVKYIRIDLLVYGFVPF